jgi:hypothetical protein
MCPPSLSPPHHPLCSFCFMPLGIDCALLPCLGHFGQTFLSRMLRSCSRRCADILPHILECFARRCQNTECWTDQIPAGHVTITNLEGLKKASCECYSTTTAIISGCSPHALTFLLCLTFRGPPRYFGLGGLETPTGGLLPSILYTFF